MRPAALDSTHSRRAGPLSHPSMPRIDPDDDHDYDDDAGTGRDWRRRLLTWTLAAVGLGLGFLIPYVLYLNHQVGERFGQLRWPRPEERRGGKEWVRKCSSRWTP